MMPVAVVHLVGGHALIAGREVGVLRAADHQPQPRLRLQLGVKLRDEVQRSAGGVTAEVSSVEQKPGVSM